MTNALMSFVVKRVSTQIPTLRSTIWASRCYSSPPSSANLSNNKIFVGGLSSSVDEKCLKESFSSFGEVTEVRIAYDRDSGRSRGFGFVHFTKEDEAVSAKEAMDGKALLGRPLRISFAIEKIRGGPVVVPRLSNARGNCDRNA